MWFIVAANSDYMSVTRTLTFPAGETELLVPVDTIGDSIAEQLEIFRATLSNPSTRLTVGDQDTATVIILDDDGTITNMAV